MLTADLIRPFLRVDGHTIEACLLDEQNPFWLETATFLLRSFQSCLGEKRSIWEQALEDLEADRTDYLRLRGLAKVLTDEAVFTPLPTASPPLEVRMSLFEQGPAFTDLDIFHSRSRPDVLQVVATALDLTPEEVDAAMFADLPDEQLLMRSKIAWTPLGLLQRYNLELTRGVLYRATIAQIRIWDNYKTIWRFLKLFNIMYWAEEEPDGGYRVTLSGPMADFIQTERYGIAFALFFPALLLGERWQMRASIVPPADKGENKAGEVVAGKRRVLHYSLDDTCALRSHYRQGRVFDSSLERTFAQEFMDFESKFGGVRGHWHLSRESDILLLERTIMLPDFTLVHETDPNRKILLELVGFWTPRYLRTKLAKIREANCSHLLVLVYERLNVTHEDFDGVSSEILFFKEKPVLKEVMAAVEAMADRVYGPLTPQRKHVGTSPSSPLLADQVRIGMTQRRLTAQEWMPLVHLHDALLWADPSFAPRLYGAATLHDLVVSSPDLFEIRRSSSRGRPWQVRVCLSRRSQEEKQDE